MLRLDRLLFRIEVIVAGASMLLIVATTATGVVSRYVFNSPIVWVSELSLFAQVWLTFIGASAVYKERGHIGMGELVAAMPPHIRRAVQTLISIILLVVVLIVGWSTIQIMQVQRGQTLSTLGLPRTFTSAPVVWAMISIAFSLLAEIVAGRGTPSLAQAGSLPKGSVS